MNEEKMKCKKKKKTSQYVWWTEMIFQGFKKICITEYNNQYKFSQF